ncbi:hypothetical protein KEJ27_03225 [Candidatus Bathyarchaeota archaeon]|nr:hypothetical protein [Candidatus Bathyarchaeota archaeon]
MAYEFISKSINKKRCRLSKLNLECRVKDDVFTMIHYNTPIFKVDLHDGKVLGHGGYCKINSAYIKPRLESDIPAIRLG